MGFKFKQNISREISEQRYNLHNEEDIETIFENISKEIASAEEKEKEKEWTNKFYEQLISTKLIPAGRILANARTFSKMKNYNNCFTIDIKDSIEEIYDSLKEDAIISKMGGGVGFDISKLRPRDAPLSKGGESSGPLSFLKVFNESAKVIHTGGFRRCLPEGTPVNTRKGIVDIEKINIGDEVLTSDGYEKVSNFFNQGKQDTIIINTDNGDFECTPNHKMAVFNGCFDYTWKKAEDLKEGDKLVFVGNEVEGIKTYLPNFNYDKPKHSTTTKDITIPELDEDIAWFIGLLFGDGYINLNENKTKGRVSIACSNDNEQIINKAKEQMERFGINVFVRNGDGDVSNVVAYSNQLAIYLNDFKQSNKNLIIPEFIWYGELNIRSAFIAGLFDADGSNSSRPINALTTVYEDFSENVVKLFSSLGIPVKKNRINREHLGWQDIFNINIANAASVRQWDRLVAPHSLKYVSKRKTKNFYQSGNNDFRFDGEIFLKEELKTKRKWNKSSKNINLTTLERIVEKEIDLYPIEVKAISQGSTDIQTYDIEVENKHEFVSNGFLTHNSAHIALMDISHPDIEEFITIKQGDSNNELTQFNISVKISNAFMKAVKKDEDWQLKFNGKVYRTVRARYLYDLVANNAFQHNEPGVFYSDNIEKYNNGWWSFKLDRVNPCGEIVMPSYSLCCLTAVNLSQFVVNPFTEDAYFDYDAYNESIDVGIRFLDNVLDKTDYPLDKIEEFSKNWRRIGLGITGLGDALVMLKVAYGSEKSKNIINDIAKQHMISSYESSMKLAKEKGSFPACDNKKLIKSNFIKEKLPKNLQKNIKKYGLRNIAVNTIAPTGTTSFSIGQNTSSGVEPIFSLEYNRNIRTGRGDEIKQETVSDYAWLLYKEKFGGEAEKPDYFSTTLEIDPYDSIDVQAIWQYYIDHSISKTLNLPKDTDKKEYDRLFEYAFSQGLKGFTTFNPFGSMKGVLEYNESQQENQQLDENGRPLTIERVNAPKRPEDLKCDIHQITANKEKHIVLIGKLNDGSIYEIFVTPNNDKEIDLGQHEEGTIRKIKKGQYQLIVQNGEDKCIVDNISKQFDETYSSLSRFISMALRHGVDLEFIVTQLQKDTSFTSFEKAVARVLKKYIKEGEKVKISETCPICGSTNLVYKEGCLTCGDCGWSKCD
ncbi:MAG: hypothetical protein K9L57_06025 [Spirochaetaceae bacterium]|nr:hypothetical protein [Spirochaetaceae bacterium]